MKKAKIFLTALTVLAVVGGALAFKAKTFNKFARACDIPQGICILQSFSSQATTLNGTLPADFVPYGKACTSDLDCTSTKTTFAP